MSATAEAGRPHDRPPPPRPDRDGRNPPRRRLRQSTTLPKALPPAGRPHLAAARRRPGLRLARVDHRGSRLPRPPTPSPSPRRQHPSGRSASRGRLTAEGRGDRRPAGVRQRLRPPGPHGPPVAATVASSAGRASPPRRPPPSTARPRRLGSLQASLPSGGLPAIAPRGRRVTRAAAPVTRPGGERLGARALGHGMRAGRGTSPPPRSAGATARRTGGGGATGADGAE